MNKLLIIAYALLSVSCATVFSDSSDIINFTSVPEGADIFVNGRKIGQTPMSEKFDRDTFSKSSVQVKLAGYEEQRFTLQKQLNKIALINFTFWPSWATDALSGNMVQYNPNSYHIFLKPEKSAQKSFETQGKVQEFVLRQYNVLLREVAHGDGENLQALWKLHAQDEVSMEDFLLKIENNSERLLQTTRAADFYLALSQMN